MNKHETFLTVFIHCAHLLVLPFLRAPTFNSLFLSKLLTRHRQCRIGIRKAALHKNIYSFLKIKNTFGERPHPLCIVSRVKIQQFWKVSKSCTGIMASKRRCIRCKPKNMRLLAVTRKTVEGLVFVSKKKTASCWSPWLLVCSGCWSPAKEENSGGGITTTAAREAVTAL